MVLLLEIDDDDNDNDNDFLFFFCFGGKLPQSPSPRLINSPNVLAGGARRSPGGETAVGWAVLATVSNRMEFNSIECGRATY